MKRKHFSFALALCMVLTLLPMTALAASTPKFDVSKFTESAFSLKVDRSGDTIKATLHFDYLAEAYDLNGGDGYIEYDICPENEVKGVAGKVSIIVGGVRASSPNTLRLTDEKASWICTNGYFKDLKVEYDYTNKNINITVTTVDSSADDWYNFRLSLRAGDGKDTAQVVVFESESTTSTPPTPTPDKPSSWAEPQVNAAIAATLVPTSLQAKYTQATTRAEFCALAVALYEKVTGTEITERKTFNDTSDINVQKMGALGVVNGVGNDNFAPDTELTREQAAVMLANLAKAIGKPLTETAATFADNGSISSWALTQVGQIQAAGIMSGVGENTFAPKNPYTREQSIITIMRLYDVVK